MEGDAPSSPQGKKGAFQTGRKKATTERPGSFMPYRLRRPPLSQTPTKLSKCAVEGAQGLQWRMENSTRQLSLWPEATRAVDDERNAAKN